MKSLGVFGPVLLLALLGACSDRRSLPATFFQALEQADQIALATPAVQFHVVAEPWRVRRLVQRLEPFREDWRRNWVGAPVPELRLIFMKEGRVLGTLGIGRGFLTSGEGHYWTRPLPDADRQALLQILRLRDRS